MTSRELELIDEVCEMILVAKFGLDYLYKKDENGDLVLTNAAQDYYIAINEDVEGVFAQHRSHIEGKQD
tara:strand:- start:9548 stop:9754 length:207 start_codon:yes stop_codon:yes gene_type:complete